MGAPWRLGKVTTGPPNPAPTIALFRSGVFRHPWQAWQRGRIPSAALKFASALALGVGIWSMHFIGMLAA